LGRGLHSGFDLRHGTKASLKWQGGDVNRERGWSHAPSPGTSAVAPTGPLALTAFPFSLEQWVPAPMDQTAAVVPPAEQSCAAPDQQQKPEVLFMNCVLVYFE